MTSRSTASSNHSSREPTPTTDNEYSLGWSILLHLLPGAVMIAFVLLAVPALETRGLDPAFALFGGIILVIAPLELGYLVWYARRTTGSWSPLAAVSYRTQIPAGKVALLAAGLAAWFLVMLVVSIAVLDRPLADGVFGWMPEALLQFSRVEEGEALTGGTLVALVILALVANGIIGPVTEELYFRGHLLPRLERFGRGAPIINTVLFGLYHFFSPWRYPAIILGFLPTTWVVWRRRNVWISTAMHVAVNMITVLLLIAALLAEA